MAYARSHDDDDVDDYKDVIGRCHVCGKKPDLLEFA